MKRAMPSLDNITWDRLEAECAVTYPCPAPDQPGLGVVVSATASRPPTAARGWCRPTIIPPAEQPDAEFPWVLTTGRHARALAHRRHDAARRNLDALEPEAFVAVNAQELRRLGLRAGDTARVATRRGAIELMARQDNAVPDGRAVHPVLLRRGRGQPADQPAARPVRQDPRVQVLRGPAGAGGAQRGRGIAQGHGPVAELYETDFYAWTRLQARELRRLKELRLNAEIDLGMSSRKWGLGNTNREAFGVRPAASSSTC